MRIPKAQTTQMIIAAILPSAPPGRTGSGVAILGRFGSTTGGASRARLAPQMLQKRASTGFGLEHFSQFIFGLLSAGRIPRSIIFDPQRLADDAERGFAS